jgi:hypothetical protein
MCQVKLCWGQNINTSRGFSALAGTTGAFGNTGRALDSECKGLLEILTALTGAVRSLSVLLGGINNLLM